MIAIIASGNKFVKEQVNIQSFLTIICLASFRQLKLAKIFSHLFPDGLWFMYGIASFEHLMCLY